MNQQQLNKIDEEFDIIFTEDKSGKNSIGIQYIDAPRSKLLNFLHSKLQEAENRTKKEINKEWLGIDLSYNNKENWDKELTKFGLYMQKVNSLQTNKE